MVGVLRMSRGGVGGRRRRRLAAVAAGGVAGSCLLGLLALPASVASAAPRVTTLSRAYVDPLQLAVQGGRILVADGDRLTEVGRSGTLASGPRGGDVSGVAFAPPADGSAGAPGSGTGSGSGSGTGTGSGIGSGTGTGSGTGPGAPPAAVYAYTSSTASHADTRLTIVAADGTRVIASLSAFERRNNPDRRVHYGVDRPSACVRKAFTALDGKPAGYLGRVDSHPVAVAGGAGIWYVADAAANAVLRVDAAGKVSLVKVLPPQPFRFSARLAKAVGLPSCVAGVPYQAEPVPTDVEVGPDGTLYVTTRPGLYDLGQRGSVYRLSPGSGRLVRVAGGFAGAANVAVTSRGVIYVAELLTGRVCVVRSTGRFAVYVNLPGVAGLEADGDRLYASVLAPVSQGIRTGPGRIVRIG